MKKFRVLYWIGSIITEKYVLAENEEEAKKKFNRVYRIEEVIE